MERFALWFCSWILWLGVALFLLLSPHAHSAPACFPGEPTASSTLPVLTADSTGCAAVWFCDEGKGAWAMNWIGRTGSECDYGYAKAVAVLALTHDQKVDLWNTTFPAATSTPTTTPSLVSSVPPPTAPPATGLTTKEIKVYKLVTQTNAAPTFSLVGTTKLGLPCDTSLRVGTLFRIDRTMVTFPAGVIMPLMTFAKCD